MQKQVIRKIFHIILLSVVTFSVSGLEIKGKVELKDGWQPIVFLASLGSPEDIFVASPDFVIAQTFIKPDGSFQLNTNDVPVDFMFYRLYMVRGDNTSVEFNTSNHRNYQHLLLNRNSHLVLHLSVLENHLNVKEMTGSVESESIMEFDKLYQQKQNALLGNITKAKSSYLSKDLENTIQVFVNNSGNALVALYALYHIDGKETHFLQNSDFYFDFQKNLDQDYSGTAYAQEYDELLKELIGFRDFVCQMPGVQPKWKDQLLLAQSIVILVLLVLLVFLFVKQVKKKKLPADYEEKQGLYNNLTTKQQEILLLLAKGKTNKEIALELFIELSTVKTHINNIYRQLGVGSRQEAADFYASINQ